MRFIGLTQISLSLMNDNIDNINDNINDIADSRILIEQSRLLILQTAIIMDKYNNNSKNINIRQYISMIKNVVCNNCCKIIDKTIQIHGKIGLSSKTDLPYFWTLCRCLRIGDGPDAVHHRVVANIELNNMNLSKL